MATPTRRFVHSPALSRRFYQGGGKDRIDLLSGGTHTRASSGSYLIGAPTNGSTAFLAWANPNVRRIEDRGDGLGQMLLMEGSRTNYLPRSREITNAAWSAGSGNTATENAANGPDGALLADRDIVPSGGYGQFQPLVAATGSQFVATFYAKRPSGSGTGEAHFAIQNGAGGTGTYGTASISEIYSRLEFSRVFSGSASGFYVPSEGRTLGGITASDLDYVKDLNQMELGAFASSPIWTEGSSATRAADILTFATGSYPDSFCSTGFEFTVAFDASSSEISAHGSPMVLVGFPGGTHWLDVRASSGHVAALVFESGNLRIITGTITFSRGQPITFRIEPALGKLTISGATSGNGVSSGTGFTWPSAALSIGTTSAGVAPMFGRFAQYIRGL